MNWIRRSFGCCYFSQSFVFLRKVGARPCAESQSKYYSPSPSSKFEHSLMNTTTKIQHTSYFKRHFAANKFQNVTNVEFRSLPLIFNSPFDLSYVSSLKQNVIVKRSSKISENCLYFKLFFKWKVCSLSKYDLKKSTYEFSWILMKISIYVLQRISDLKNL